MNSFEMTIMKIKHKHSKMYENNVHLYIASLKFLLKEEKEESCI